MTTNQLLILSSTILFLALIAARAFVSSRKEAASADVVVANRNLSAALAERQAGVLASQLAGAVQTLNATAAALHALEECRGPARVGQRVTVHTKRPDEHTIYGVVTADYVDRLVLEDADYVTARGPEPIPGRPEIEHANIAWIDVHGPVVRAPETAPAHPEE
jgi:hypothetical protein